MFGNLLLYGGVESGGNCFNEGGRSLVEEVNCYRDFFCNNLLFGGGVLLVVFGEGCKWVEIISC